MAVIPNSCRECNQHDCINHQFEWFMKNNPNINNANSVSPACPLLKEVPQEPRKGHWIEQIDHEENCRTLICSNCDRPALHDEDSIWKHKFCPHCGAKMVEPQESEDT